MPNPSPSAAIDTSIYTLQQRLRALESAVGSSQVSATAKQPTSQDDILTDVVPVQQQLYDMLTKLNLITSQLPDLQKHVELKHQLSPLLHAATQLPSNSQIVADLVLSELPTVQSHIDTHLTTYSKLTTLLDHTPEALHNMQQFRQRVNAVEHRMQQHTKQQQFLHLYVNCLVDTYRQFIESCSYRTMQICADLDSIERAAAQKQR